MRACLLSLVLLTGLVHAAEPIDGRSRERWRPALAWVTNPPQQYAVRADAEGSLVFSARGAGGELPFLLSLSPAELDGDSRYLLLRYRAEGLVTTPGNYFLHAEEGTPGGRALLLGDEVVSDGAWHLAAIDLVALRPAQPLHLLALKVRVGTTGQANVTVQRIWFADELPAGAQMARAKGAPSRSVRWGWDRLQPLDVMRGWNLAPADDCGASVTGTQATFTVGNPNRGMRWRAKLPEPVDLGTLNQLTFRYRVDGALGPTAYAIWLGDRAEGSGGHAVVAVPAARLISDGQWHRLTVALGQKWSATHLAVGIDALGEPVRLTFDTITFSAGPPDQTVAEALPHERLEAPWPTGRDGWRPLRTPAAGGRSAASLPRQLQLADWLAAPEIAAVSVPFSVATDPAQVRQTGTTDLGAIRWPLPAGAGEIYLLYAVAAPANEPFGIDSHSPRPMEWLDVPEKAVCEVRYADGPPDFVLPTDVATGHLGFARGLGVGAVRTDLARRPTELVLHDYMRSASFALLGVTVRPEPRVAPFGWTDLTYPTPPAGALRGKSLAGQLAAEGGLRWSTLGVAGLPEVLQAGGGPVFQVSVGGRALRSESWKLIREEPAGAGRRYVLRCGEPSLEAQVDAVPAGNELRLNLSLRNLSGQPLTMSARFPMLSDLRLGTAAETWYLFGKRGGIINYRPVQFREPLGECHPLQCDGVFNPKLGVGLALLTHETQPKHHFVNFAKTATGVNWAPEYVDRDLGPGATWAASEAALQLVEGDWRAIFDAYRAWLKTWYRPPAAKPWWTRSFADVGAFAHYDGNPDPKARGAIQPLIEQSRRYLGSCDLVHLFGWAATKQYGDWGDYEHYDLAVGGLDYFRGNIAAAQAQGVAVSLYLDAYLSCERGQLIGAKAREWAMKHRDGSPQYIKEYDAYNQCPYLPGWQDYLSATYGRIARATGVKALYIDEFGTTDGRWTCWAKDHGHDAHEIPYAGEVAMLQRIRAAVGPDVALYTEYPPAEVARQYQDGSLTYQAIWSVDQEPLAPHFIDLPRFAFPAFKQLHLIHYVAVRDGNDWPLKYPFFNGESYRVGAPNLPGFDERAMAFQRRAVEVLCALREAFASDDVEPLVPTLVPGVFANRFRTPRTCVWTLYNSNSRSVRGPLLRVPHVERATYRDAWRDQALQPAIEAGQALVGTELGPKAVGCVVQQRP